MPNPKLQNMRYANSHAPHEPHPFQKTIFSRLTGLRGCARRQGRPLGQPHGPLIERPSPTADKTPRPQPSSMFDAEPMFSLPRARNSSSVHNVTHTADPPPFRTFGKPTNIVTRPLCLDMTTPFQPLRPTPNTSLRDVPFRVPRRLSRHERSVPATTSYSHSSLRDVRFRVPRLTTPFSLHNRASLPLATLCSIASIMARSSKTGPWPSHLAFVLRRSETSPTLTRPLRKSSWPMMKSQVAPTA